MQAQVRLAGDDSAGLLVGIGRDDDFREQLDDLFRRLAVERRVERDNAAEGRNRVTGEGACVSVLQRLAGGDAARIGMFDDRAGRAVFGQELRDQLDDVIPETLSEEEYAQYAMDMESLDGWL